MGMAPNLLEKMQRCIGTGILTTRYTIFTPTTWPLDKQTISKLDMVPLGLQRNILQGLRQCQVWLPRLHWTSCYSTHRECTTMPKDTQQTMIKIVNMATYTHGSHGIINCCTNMIDRDNCIWATALKWVKYSIMKDYALPPTWNTIACAIVAGTCITIVDGSFDPSTFIPMACWITNSRRKFPWTM